MEKRAVKELIITEEEYSKVIAYLDANIEKIYLQFPSEFADIFAYEEKLLRIMIKLAWYKAFRIMEILQLQVKDVVLIKDKNQIEFKLRRKKRLYKERYRFSILTPWKDIKDLIECYNLSPNDYLFSRRECEYKKPLVLRTANKRINKLLNKLNINREGMAWHGFRRGRATQLCNNSADIKDIQCLLNHRQEAVTKRYIESSCDIVRVFDDKAYAHLL